MSHSNIGPSSAERWMACPGSVRLSKDAPPSFTSSFAAEGVVAHTLAEELTSGQVDDMTLMARVGETVEEAGHTIEITEEMVLGVAEYANLVAQDLAALRREGRTARVEEHTEVRVRLASVDPDLYGTADKIIFRKGHKLIVYDFKYGKGKIVSAEKNPQMSIYALAAMETLAGEAFDEIETVIVQPRAGGERRWIVDKQWLREFKEEVRKAIEATRQPDAPLKAGVWCRWCRALSICPEAAGAAQAAAGVDFALAPPPAKDITVNASRVEGLTVAQLTKMLDWSDAIEALYNALWARAQNILETGGAVPGYKLVAGRSTRKWVDGTGESAAATFAPIHGEKVYAPKKVLSVAQMEKLVGAKSLPSALVVKAPGANKVADEADPRPSVVSSAQADFMPAPTVGIVDPLFALPAPAAKKPFWP